MDVTLIFKCQIELWERGIKVQYREPGGATPFYFLLNRGAFVKKSDINLYIICVKSD
jgi:hypothetical protein